MLAPESPVERGFRLVPHASRNFEHAVLGGGEKARALLQAPPREVGHRWLVKIVREALGKRRSRSAYVSRQHLEGPAP